MDKRLKEHIDKLLRLYDEARTTDEQERELADFFSQPHDTLPEEWERYAALFTAFAGSESLFSEAELEAMAAPRTSRRFWPWLMGAAATVTLLVGLFLHQPHTTEASDYLATNEQPIPDMEELGITTVDSALIGRIAGLDIVSNSSHLDDSNNVMRLGGDCPQPAESIPAHSDSNKIERMEGMKNVMVAKAEPKTEPAPTISPSDEVRIGQTQMKKTAPQLTFNTPTLDVDKVFIPKDSSLSQFTGALSKSPGTTTSRVRGTMSFGHQRREEETIPAYVVSVNGELLPDSMNYLATLSLNKIREYFLSRGEVVEDFDYRVVKDETERQKYIERAKGKHTIVELRIKTKPLKLDMTAADSSLIGRRAGVDTVSAHSGSIGSAHMKEKIKVPDSLSVK